MAVSATLLTGRADAFTPRNLLFPTLPFGNSEPPSLFDTTPLHGAVVRLVDFERLNAGTPRFFATAVDAETGEDVVFDTAKGPIGPDHLRASSAMMPVFPPVEVEGRLLADAGISANLPLDPVLESLSGERMLVVAVDLLPLSARRPATLTEVAERMHDLTFATQSRRAIAGWRRLFAERAAAGRPTPAVTLVHLIYADQAREVVGKASTSPPRPCATAGTRARAMLRPCCR
jgi:NTE family protein